MFTVIQFVHGTAQTGTQRIPNPIPFSCSVVPLRVTLTFQRAAPLLYPLISDPDASRSLVQSPHSLIPNLGGHAVKLSHREPIRFHIPPLGAI